MGFMKNDNKVFFVERSNWGFSSVDLGGVDLFYYTLNARFNVKSLSSYRINYGSKL